MPISVRRKNQNSSEHHPRDSVCNTIAHIVSVTTETMRNSSGQPDTHNIFSSGDIPKITLFDYLIRFATYAYVGSCELIIAFILVNRFIEAYYRKFNKNPFNHLTVHRLFASALIISQKYCSDLYFSMRFLHSVAGISQHECAVCELSFIQTIDCNIYVSLEEFELYKNMIFAFSEKLSQSPDFCNSEVADIANRTICKRDRVANLQNEHIARSHSV